MAKKKVLKKPLPKKKRVKSTGKQKPLPTMEDEFKVPKKLQVAADRYNEMRREKAMADADFKAAKTHMIDTMKQLQISRVRVEGDGGVSRIFRYTYTDKIVTEKAKKEAASKQVKE